jgi:NAD(P)-dependent dehydrogenase (short-subunit alcohol dehydrogenase family)
LGSSGIRVNNLAPGAVETDLNRDSLDRIGMDNFARRIPLRRVGAPEDIVGPALFLASDASRYVTGTTIFVDGGYLQNLLRF